MNANKTPSQETGNELDISQIIEAFLLGVVGFVAAIVKTFHDVILKPRQVEFADHVVNTSDFSTRYVRPLTYLLLGLLTISGSFAFSEKNGFTEFFMMVPFFGVVVLHGIITYRIASVQGQKNPLGFYIALSAYSAGTCAWLFVFLGPLYLFGSSPAFAEMLGIQPSRTFSLIVEGIGGILAWVLILRLIYCYIVMLRLKLNETLAPAAGRIWIGSAIQTLIVALGVLFWCIAILEMF